MRGGGGGGSCVLPPRSTRTRPRFPSASPSPASDAHRNSPPLQPGRQFITTVHWHAVCALSPLPQSRQNDGRRNETPVLGTAVSRQSLAHLLTSSAAPASVALVAHTVQRLRRYSTTTLTNYRVRKLTRKPRNSVCTVRQRYSAVVAATQVHARQRNAVLYRTCAVSVGSVSRGPLPDTSRVGPSFRLIRRRPKTGKYYVTGTPTRFTNASLLLSIMLLLSAYNVILLVIVNASRRPSAVPIVCASRLPQADSFTQRAGSQRRGRPRSLVRYRGHRSAPDVPTFRDPLKI